MEMKQSGPGNSIRSCVRLGVGDEKQREGGREIYDMKGCLKTLNKFPL